MCHIRFHKASPPLTDSLPLPSPLSSPSLLPPHSPWVALNEDFLAANSSEDSIDHPLGNGPTSSLSKSPVSWSVVVQRDRPRLAKSPVQDEGRESEHSHPGPQPAKVHPSFTTVQVLPILASSAINGPEDGVSIPSVDAESQGPGAAADSEANSVLQSPSKVAGVASELNAPNLPPSPLNPADGGFEVDGGDVMLSFDWHELPGAQEQHLEAMLESVVVLLQFTFSGADGMPLFLSDLTWMPFDLLSYLC
ncbi:hypothetical protein Nepgr_030843 [Nepenthes gracilis]|uniref:Uncharacterized protein n=1 Tax=Nepenthes gracilis TaxID=150966 RepID=A0AAD3TFC3_NEPGR|nr:hypothetical protein Nepgr_030843 [Nepenthes gracilis]